MLLQELVAPFYSNHSLMSSDLPLLSERNAFNNMMTVGLLRSPTDIYSVHRWVTCYSSTCMEKSTFVMYSAFLP